MIIGGVMIFCGYADGTDGTVKFKNIKGGVDMYTADGIRSNFYNKTEIDEKMTNIVVKSYKKYPMFIIPLNDIGLDEIGEHSITTGFSDFELKASTNNFNSANSENKWPNYMTFWCISKTNATQYSEMNTNPYKPTHHTAMLKFVNDAFEGKVSPDSNHTFDARSRLQYNDIAIDCNNLTPKYVVVIIDVDALNEEYVNPDELRPAEEWLYEDNDDLMWTFVRLSAGTQEAETNEKNCVLWHPIEPVKWLSKLPNWAKRTNKTATEFTGTESFMIENKRD